MKNGGSYQVIYEGMVVNRINECVYKIFNS